MRIDTKGPYQIDRIHHFPTDRRAMVTSLTLIDDAGNEIGMRFDTLAELRAAAAAFPLTDGVRLLDSLHGEPVKDVATIRRWIRADQVMEATS